MRFKSVWMAIVLFALGTGLAVGQVTTATISGTVADSSGAVLPGAKVSITNEGTGLVREVVTDVKGHYTAPLLPVGSYKVEGGEQGFQSEVRTGIEMTVGREAVVDLKLQVGAVTQTVEVTGEAPLVQTTEATVSYLVADQTMRDLPLNDRDMSQLILLNPGVTETETTIGASLGSSSFNGFGRRISISGARGEDNTYLLDGGMIGDFRRHIPAGPSGALLGVESTQEFQVLTNSYSAQYGRSLGGVFNAVSKSGTNQYHGDAYDFLRNQVMDANSWQNNIVIPSSSDVKPPLRRNQFGATFGGPIKKEKIFFFASYEATRERLGAIEQNSVPDANALLGNFSAVQNGPIKGISPAMAPYIQWYPAPTPGTPDNVLDGTQGYIWNYSQPTNEDYGQGRVDLPALTNSDSAFIRFTGSSSIRNQSSGFPGYLQIDSLSSALATLSETHIFSPTFLNSVRFHFNRVIPKDVGAEPAPCGTAQAGTGCVPAGVQYAPGSASSPLVSPSGLTSEGGGGYATSPTIMLSNRFTVQDDATWTKGSHSIQIGGQLERSQDNTTKPNRYTGTWSWATLQTFFAGTCNNLGTGYTGAVPTTCSGANASSPTLTTESAYRGAPVATALETVPSVLSTIGATLSTLPSGFDTYNRAFRQWTLGLFIQDNWRASKKLTVNMGVRWEPYTVPYEIHNDLANVVNIFNNNVATVGNPYWKQSSRKDFSPRIGFAWDPFGNGRTSIRGGGGLLFEPNDENLFYNQADRMPPLAFDFSITGNGHFPFLLNEIAAQPTLGPAFAVAPTQRSPHQMQYNFSIQQQLSSADVVSIGYAGSRGYDLVGLAQDNTPFAVYDGQSLAIPTATGGVVGTGTVNTNYSDLNEFQTAYSSWYNSLQATYQRRFSKGLQTQVAYTFQKNQSNSDTAQTANEVNLGGGSSAGLYTWNPNTQKALSGYDIRQTLKVNYSYDLPSAKMFSKGIAGKILGGWQTTGVITLHSGHPSSVTVGVPTVLSNERVLVRNPNNNPGFTGSLILGPPNSNSTEVCPTTSTCYAPYFNIAAYIANPCVANNTVGTQPSNPSGVGVIGPNCLGTYELGNLGRDTLVSPGLITWDPGLFKNFTITEKTKLQFRLEMFNALNRPNFGAPSASLVSATGTPSTSAGKIGSTVGSPRNVQLALKLSW